MKNLLKGLAVSACIAGLSTNIYAGTFSDVPQGHWSYKAVEEVSAKGIIKGYKEKFGGERNVSRYEMALIVSRLLNAVSKGATVPAGANADLVELVQEFGNELALMGAKVDVVAAKADKNEKRIEALESSSSNIGVGGIKMKGYMGLRWQGHFADGMSDVVSSDPQAKIDLGFSGKLNDKSNWGINFGTGSTQKPNSSWTTFGGSSAFGKTDFNLTKFFFDYQATDDLKFVVGKQDNPFKNTELVFDADVKPAGISESYKINDKWSVSAGQYFVKEGYANGTGGTGVAAAAGAKLGQEDVGLFAHGVSFNDKRGNSAWTVNASNLNFTGEQYLHPAQTGGEGVINRIASATGTTFADSNSARSGNYYNQDATGAAHTRNATTANRANRLLSDFNLFNIFIGWENQANANDPWGVKLDYVVNNSAWNGDDSGLWFEIYRGRLSQKGDVRYGYQYKRVEADATLAWMNEDQLGTNVKGSAVYVQNRLRDNIDWVTTYFLFEPVHGVSTDKSGFLRTGFALTF
ncbi:MAG: putative porin [Candidatus Cloacimonetes bacterium]|nr:putative porin [Candidatus Cloacimonadota bacterium]